MNDLYQYTVFCEESYNTFSTWFSFFVNKKEKINYKAKLFTSSLLKKNKIDKDNFEEKNHEEKHYSNS